MNDTAYLLFVVLLVVIVGLCVFFARPFWAWWGQKRTDRMRRRAHQGKVTCEEKLEACERIATVVTHNGYFCPEHWEQNSKYDVPGGYVTWHHVLNHSVRRT